MHIASPVFPRLKAAQLRCLSETGHYDKMIRLLMLDGKKQKALTLFFGTVFKVAQKLPSSAFLAQESQNLLLPATGAFRGKHILDKDITLLNKMNLLGFLVEGIGKRSLGFKSSLLPATAVSGEVESQKAFAFSNTRTQTLETTNCLIEKSIRLKNPTKHHFGSQIIDQNQNSSAVFLVLSKAIQNVMPYLEVRKVRVSGKTRQIPSMIRANRQRTLAIRWLIEAARKRQKRNGRLADCLANELIEAFEKQGTARQKRNELHKIAHANRTFLRYRWW